MAETQETSADIIKKMRRDGIVHNSIPTRYLNAYADRLEAALKREKAAIEANALAVGGIVGAAHATAEKSSAVCDAAKLREALLAFVRAYEQEDEMSNIEDTAEAYELARSALAETKCNMN